MRKHKLTRAQFIALGFFLIIIMGAILLMLPCMSKNGKSTDFLTTLFTATSATCVTGLVRVDTFTHYTVLGQILILIMIEIGGMGFVTIGVWFSVLFRRKITLSQRGLMQESINAMKLEGIVKLTKKIIRIVAITEIVGAILLSFYFVPELGLIRGIYYSVFHSVSAFCNAGFDLMGYRGEYSSLTTLYDNVYVNVVIMGLIVLGGIGFVVWDDIITNGINFKKYKLHSRIVILVTTVLIFGGAILFYHLEINNLEATMTMKERILTSFFSSVTPRTAGFNSVDTGALTTGSKFLTIVLMFIGGSPGSTAGGIKTTTIAILICNMISGMRGEQDTNIFDRRVEKDVVSKASLVFMVNLMVAIIGIMIICNVQNFEMDDVIFECFSAIGTVRMSTGITRSLNAISQVVIIMLMFIGRIGSMTFAFAFLQNRHTVAIRLPKEDVSVG